MNFTTTIKCALILFLLCFISNNLLAQQKKYATTPSTPQKHRCAADEYLQQRLIEDPAFAKQFETWTSMSKDKVPGEKILNCNGTNSVVIPVAIHYGGGVDCTNPTCLIEAAEAQVQVLNDDFGATNSDFTYYTQTLNGICPVGYPLSNAPIAGNGSCIQFCLASKDHPASSGLQDGEPAITLGAEQWPSAGSEWSGYLNIFVSDGAAEGFSGLLGIAPVPGSADGDGFWVTKNAFGGPGVSCSSGGSVNSSGAFDLGRTATHEAGHYFGLYHTFQGGCSDGDSNPPGPVAVNDTPAEASSFSGCPTVSSCANAPTSCSGSYSPFYNFMDYSNDACLVMFSEDQSNVINYWGNQLTWKSDAIACDFTHSFTDVGGCEITAPIADFSPTGTVDICTGGCIIFSDESTGDNATSWSWTFTVASGDIVLDVTSSTEQNQLVCVSSGTSGTIDVTFTATNSEGSDTTTETITVTVDNNCESGCVTISNIDLVNHNLVVYDSNNSGYVSGSNGYDDEAKADYFDPASYGLCSQFDVTGLNLVFGAADAGASGSISAVIWDSDGANGGPGTVLGTVVIPISVIQNDVAANVTTFADFSNAPVAINGPFFAGISGLTSITGGDIGLLTNTDGEISPASGWEEFSDGNWYPYDASNSWGLEIANAIFPVILPPEPVVDITIATGNNCDQDEVQFFNNSTMPLCSGATPTFVWTITAAGGGASTPTPNIYTDEHPIMIFNSPGVYIVELCVTGESCESACSNLIVIIDDCCPTTINVPDPLSANAPLGSGHFNASDWVKSNAAIINGEVVLFEGGNYVELQSGFEVPLGAELTANNNGCTVTNPRVEGAVANTVSTKSQKINAPEIRTFEKDGKTYRFSN